MQTLEQWLEQKVGNDLTTYDRIRNGSLEYSEFPWLRAEFSVAAVTKAILVHAIARFTPISFESFENAVMDILEDSPIRCEDRSDDDGKYYTFSTVGGCFQTSGSYSQLDDNRWTVEFMDRMGTGETLAEAIADMNKGLEFPEEEEDDEEEDL